MAIYSSFDVQVRNPFAIQEDDLKFDFVAVFSKVACQKRIRSFEPERNLSLLLIWLFRFVFAVAANVSLDCFVAWFVVFAVADNVSLNCFVAWFVRHFLRLQ